MLPLQRHGFLLGQDHAAVGLEVVEGVLEDVSGAREAAPASRSSHGLVQRL